MGQGEVECLFEPDEIFHECTVSQAALFATDSKGDDRAE
jgi:hypothetical protein